jgi:hypothetical protein
VKYKEYALWTRAAAPKPVLRQVARPGREGGFALVVTILLMVLLAVVAVGLLGLAAVAFRSTRLVDSKREAEANARMAMMMALGELQQAMGPDQRVSARASAVVADARQPHLLGVWRGWRWQPALAGRPDYPGKSAKFDRWLASAAQPGDLVDPAYPSRDASGVWLVDPTAAPLPAGASSLQPSNGVKAGLVTVASSASAGGMSWAVFDESCKAPVDLEPGATRDKAFRVGMRGAPERARPDALAADLAALKTPRNVITLDTAALQSGVKGLPEVRGRIHDFGVGSLGVLANAAAGGLKIDLTTLFESAQTMTATLGEKQPYFGLSADVNGVPQWEYLRAHYGKYRKLTGSASGRASYTPPALEITPSDVGEQRIPVDERLLPVIAKMQILFSVVGHYNHLGGRINFFDQYGTPPGNTKYAAPHLVYDPVVTLWNPYDVSLDLSTLRIRVWDPPVGFQVKKNNDWLRDEFAAGEFHGLARFQIQNERNPAARRFFTLHLRGADSVGSPSARLTLLPGEVKVFSPWVEYNWNWAMEIAGGYSPRSFFDWNAGTNMGNIDNRNKDPMGIESIPGWDTRAGLQVDHISYGSRPIATRYDFEQQHGMDGGWLCIKLDDTFTVNAKALRTQPPGTEPDFGVDLLAAVNPDVTTDILRGIDFRFSDVTQEVSATPKNPVIQRTFRMRDILQTPDDTSPGGKTPFAVLTMTARTTVDPADLSKAWLYQNPVVEGVSQDTRTLGVAHQSYDLRFEEVQDFNTFPGIEIDGKTNRGFFGASATANRGVSSVPMFRVPRVPATSLGDLIPANLISSTRQPRVNFPFGNSWAHPLVPSTTISQSTSGGGTMVDHGYLLNDSLWDRFYFSTVCACTTDLFTPKRTRLGILDDLFAGKRSAPPLNRRIVAAPDNRPASKRAATIHALADKTLSQTLAGELLVSGSFNLNSDSVEAWRAVLSSLRDEAVLGWAAREFPSTAKTAFTRTGAPLAGDADRPGDGTSFNLTGQIRWAGFRALSDVQITSLAESIVRQIRKRGQADKAPLLSNAEFVNRRIGPATGLHVLRGLLQTAIDETTINTPYHRKDLKEPNDSKAASFAAIPAAKVAGVKTQQAMDGLTGEGSPSFLTQGDILMPLAAVMTVRGDTFRIRSYGESRDSSGKVLARARAETIVQRLPGYLDPADLPQTAPGDLTSPANQRFGRRFVVTSFRWLEPDEA